MASVTTSNVFQQDVFQGSAVFQGSTSVLVHNETLNVNEPRKVFNNNIFQNNVFQTPNDDTGVVVIKYTIV